MNALSNRTLLTQLFEWWRGDEGVPEPRFSADFVVLSLFEDQSEADDWLRFGRHRQVWTDVLLHDVVCDDRAAALLFDATDPITAMRRRVAWMVRFEGGEVVRLVASNSVIVPRGQ